MKKSGSQIMWGLLGMVKPMAHIMFLCIFFGVVGFLCAIGITVLAMDLMLEVMGQSTIGLGFQTTCVVMVAIGVLRGVFRYVEQTCGHYIAFKLLADIRDRVFGKLRSLAPAKLEVKGRGDLISLITSDVELLEVFYAHTIAPVCIGVVVSIIMSICIGSFNFVLGLYSLFAYVAMGYILPTFLYKRNNNTGLEIRNKLGELNSFFLESLRGIEETIQFDDSQNRSKAIDEKTSEINTLQGKVKEHEGLSFALSSMMIVMLTLGMLVIGIVLKEDFSTILITTTALFSSFGPVLALSNLSAILTGTIASGERVLSLLEEEPMVNELAHGDCPEFTGVDIKDISFAYGEEEILHKVSTSFSKGDTVLISGKSGSGKSTLLKLLMRFWQAKEGEINIGNSDVSKIKTSYLRSLESFMTQDTDMFQGTIKENIAIGKLNSSDEEIIEAAKKASIHDFIMKLANGYDTKVSELGESLSGGERQRIGLARGFLHNGELMLLDEPTSNLDSLNEGIILKSIKEIKKDKTVLIVSHRKSTTAVADKVYKMAEGRMS